ncbi:hypothetical protein LHV13_02880 [Ferrovum sp. PN-J185]|uniref:HVO_A0114 family putative DNA-binding protein n=1 Tax=Ferrovum sp. PN-J185 TaxID=1356306 RepID=UPI001E52AAFB|nr:hypothetical protein [Ferrovum sp. PN-J185]MCC6068121.1 hypothetical protein [Ferrovum sp. PN-J185]
MKKSEPLQWERAKRMAFWDQGKLTYRNWSKEFYLQKANVVTQSVNYMRARDLIELVGEKQFIKTWPAIRNSNRFQANKKAILDAIWSFYVVGDVSFPVSECVIHFHPKKRETLKKLISSSGNESIYAIAKSLGRNPRRIYDDVHDFSNKGLVVLESAQREGRKVLLPKVRGCHVSAGASSLDLIIT